MKKLTFFMLALTIMGGIFTGCKKDKENNVEPTATEYTVEYRLLDHTSIYGQVFYLSECFSYDFTYTGADGKAVEVKDAKAGWSTQIKVKAPFTAKIEGQIKYVESELPEHVVYSNTLANISYSGHISSGMSASTDSKERFLERVTANPDLLKFSETAEIK